MRSVGIDLGTTNSVAATAGTAIHHSTGDERTAVLPSVAAFLPNGAELVGAHARRRRAIDPKNTLYSTKRLMGRRGSASATTRFRAEYPFEVIEASDGGVAFRTRAGDFTPVDIGARIIGKLLGGAESATAARAVIAVPALFDNEARAATSRAAEQAGLRDVRVLDEPIATALAYSTITSASARRALVYDLGGGTFDLALIEHDSGSARVLCHAGDPYLGGDDIDRAIADWVASQVLRAHGWDLRSDAEVYDRLLVQCERAKIRLGYAPTASIELGQVDPAAPAATEAIALSREKLRELSMPFVQRTFAIADQVLRDAGISTERIDAVYLAGGATLMASVRDGVAAYFNTLPRCDFDPLEVVALGASLHASAGA